LRGRGIRGNFMAIPTHVYTLYNVDSCTNYEEECQDEGSGNNSKLLAFTKILSIFCSMLHADV
jgi:hypothetical protein